MLDWVPGHQSLHSQMHACPSKLSRQALVMEPMKAADCRPTSHELNTTEFADSDLADSYYYFPDAVHWFYRQAARCFQTKCSGRLGNVERTSKRYTSQVANWMSEEEKERERKEEKAQRNKEIHFAQGQPLCFARSRWRRARWAVWRRRRRSWRCWSTGSGPRCRRMVGMCSCRRGRFGRSDFDRLGQIGRLAQNGSFFFVFLDPLVCQVRVGSRHEGVACQHRPFHLFFCCCVLA